MKQIYVSDEDYETIMELSKELQMQENDYQAFPYFWSPRSTKKVLGTDDDEKIFYKDGGVNTAEELFNDDELRKEYLENREIYLDWDEYLEEKGYTISYQKNEKIVENNFSLFKSDVKNHVQMNSHHLGKDPHTYANTIFRMPKMTKLIECIYRLNPQKEEIINNEAKRKIVIKNDNN
jgi:hypothetical protein